MSRVTPSSLAIALPTMPWPPARTGGVDHRDDVVAVGRAGDQPRPFVDHRVPDLARPVVARVARAQQLAVEVALELPPHALDPR